MREKKKFGQRQNRSNSLEPKKKFLLLYEGDKTEAIYFDTIDKNKSKLGISQMIELVPILKNYSEQGFSNPQKMLDILCGVLKEQECGVYTYDTVLNNLMDYIVEKKYDNVIGLKRDVIWKSLRYCIENEGKKLDEKVHNLEEVCDLVQAQLKKFSLEEILENIDEIMNWAHITYEKGFDKICLIVDRDKDSFSESQYERVLNTCRKEEYKFYLTNPCFEFWLLLHYDDIDKLEEEKLLDNKKATSNRTYAENELKKRMGGYKKNNYRADELIDKLDKALDNANKFCMDIDELKYKVGTNLPELINQMRLKDVIKK